MFVGNEGGGQTAAILHRVVQTCTEIGVDPRQHLADALIRLRQGGDPRELTPHAWVLVKFRGELAECQEYQGTASRGRGVLQLETVTD